MTDLRALYPVFQAHLSHENDNLNQRLFWFLFSQSLLFGAYSSALNMPEKARSDLVAHLQDALVWLIPTVALALSAIIYPLIVISVRHMTGLRKQFEDQGGASLDDLPPLHGDATLRKLGDAAYLTLPLAQAAAWLYLLGRVLLGR